MKYLLAIVLLFSFGQARVATAFSGDMLLEWCEAYFKEDSAIKGSACISYVVGVVDTEATYVFWK